MPRSSCLLFVYVMFTIGDKVRNTTPSSRIVCTPHAAYAAVVLGFVSSVGYIIRYYPRYPSVYYCLPSRTWGLLEAFAVATAARLLVCDFHVHDRRPGFLHWLCDLPGTAMRNVEGWTTIHCSTAQDPTYMHSSRCLSSPFDAFFSNACGDIHLRRNVLYLAGTNYICPLSC